ncbi:MAG: hypothetical protein G3W63_19485 [Xanthomonas euvesicatoria]|uniref:Uncharacterized protein n=2 Tax=root TaxID=1 RepID=A0A5P8PQQ1_9CAUD|nr:hypothetical protein KEM14_gp35 [Xanthomonas virus phiXaf18]NEK74944.1 hypothetical protein [Xanthomonas euvesicatoria]NEK91676.1 hypothetical protein [Xanthomonas euvesicatoria]NEL31714.1 hypothetical protein [Xanthomonas euvesicatoria]QFR59589.1 hypothetical protein phiXaf18_35 [Xanthomonas virus phiXaf18]
MKTLRNLVLVMLGVVAVLAYSPTASAQSLEIRSLTSDRGWHGVGGGLQVHQPTLEVSPPWVGVWQRSARSNRYGDWIYIKVLINCQQWSQIVFATLDEDLNFVLMSDVTGAELKPTWPDAGTIPDRTITAVCGLYGFTKPFAAAPLNPRDFVER